MENIYDQVVGSMRFTYLLPHFTLRDFITSYNFIEGNNPPMNTSMHVISNGHVELYMHFDNTCISVERKNSIYNLNNYFIGINDGGDTINLGPGKGTHKLNGLIVRFTHKGINKLLGVKISDLHNEILAGEEILKSKGKELFDRLYDLSEISTKKEILDDFFIKKCSGGGSYHPIDLDLISEICNSKDQRATVENLAHVLCLSYRTLSRKFENETGICPKEYMKILRVNKICQLINKSKIVSLPEILYYGGYYDQSHFIREFREVMNIAPNELLKRSNGNFYVTRGVTIM